LTSLISARVRWHETTGKKVLGVRVILYDGLAPGRTVNLS
jgi:hypothetical protein